MERGIKNQQSGIGFRFADVRWNGGSQESSCLSLLMSLVQQTMKRPHTMPHERTMVMIPAVVIMVKGGGDWVVNYFLRLWNWVEVRMTITMKSATMAAHANGKMAPGFISIILVM